MYKTPTFKKTEININESVEGETIETKIERIVNNKEPIKDGAPLIYTERKNGVERAFDIRTDRFEVAIEATDKIAKSYLARRENRVDDNKKEEGKIIDINKNDGKAESSSGTAE